MNAAIPSRIRFLIPYFGKWPFWMPFFLESCRRNHDIDWLFFSDCGTPDHLPDNVHIQAIRYEDYLSHVSDRLGIGFSPASPYKLCDIKPAYGFIHEDILQGYDFWAFGDIDVIYGKLRDFFTEDLLHVHDLISNHARRISGHLCLVRNNPRMNGLFKRIPNWQQRFRESHQALDEGAFSRLFIWRKNFPPLLFRFVGLFNPLRRKSVFREAYSTPDGVVPWTDGSRNFPSYWFWNEGRLMNDKDGQREFPYLHFMVWKLGAWRQLDPETFADYPHLARREIWHVSAKGFSASTTGYAS
jgi:hypothetical protein